MLKAFIEADNDKDDKQRLWEYLAYAAERLVDTLNLPFYGGDD